MKKILFAILVFFETQTCIAQIPTCPIKLPLGDFNRSSPFGDIICPALTNINTAVNGLGTDINRKINDLKRDMESFAKNTLDAAVDKDAVDKFNVAMNSFSNVKKEILDIINDAQCGVPGAFNAMQTGFKRAGEDFVKVSAMAVKFGDAFSKLMPVVPEIIKILGEIKSISSVAENQTPEIKRQLAILNTTIEEIRNDFTELSKLDASKAVSSGQNLVTGLVPYLGSCDGCAASLAIAVQGLITTGGGAGGGAVASETGIGAAIGAAVAVVGGSQTILSTLVSTPTCAYVTANFVKVAGYVNDINEFTESASKLITSLSNNSDKVVSSSKALIEVGKLLSKESESRFKNIHTSLGIIAKTLNTTANMIEQDVMPSISNFAGDKVKQISDDVKQLKYCYDKILTVGKVASQQAISNLNIMATVATSAVDVKKIINNLQGELNKAGEEAQKALRAKWNNLNTTKERLIIRLLGSKPDDLGAVVMHLTTLGDKMSDIFKDAAALAGNVADMVASSLNSGKNIFQNSLSDLVNAAREKYKFIEDNTRAVQISEAKRRALSSAAEKMKENATMEAASQIKATFVKFQSLRNVVTLNIN